MRRRDFLRAALAGSLGAFLGDLPFGLHTVRRILLSASGTGTNVLLPPPLPGQVLELEVINGDGAIAIYEYQGAAPLIAVEPGDDVILEGRRGQVIGCAMRWRAS